MYAWSYFRASDCLDRCYRVFIGRSHRKPLARGLSQEANFLRTKPEEREEVVAKPGMG